VSAGDSRVRVRGWWGERWAAMLDTAGASAARRVARGQGLARRGAVSDLTITPGRIEAVVTEDRTEPLTVVVGWPQPSDAAWDAAIDALGTELRFTAALLEGAIDEELADALAAAGIPLLPALDDLRCSCPCPERARLCRHVAAVVTVAGPVIERDPDLLLRLRGRDRTALLRRLRADDTAPERGPAVDLSVGLDAAHGDLDAVVLHPAQHDDPAGLFRHLGPPPGVEDDRALAGIIERAAATAWRLAAGDGSDAADEELLLAQLRAHRVATATALATALGREPEDVREELDRLFDAGSVLRTGAGDRARYRATST
jgi:uncharacterized Zn finger protein